MLKAGAGVRDPWARVYGVQQLLVVQLDAGDVDDAEPVELLRLGAGAYVHGQRVAEDTLLDVTGQVEEEPPVEAVLSGHVGADADGALLAVHDLVARPRAGSPVHPVHDVQGQPLEHGAHDLVAPVVLVDELALVGRRTSRSPP